MVFEALSQPQITVKSITLEGRTYTGYLMEMENAVLGFFYEGEAMRLGTLAIAIPTPQPLTRTTSTILLGHKNVNIARIVAEYLAAKKNKISLASIYLKEADLACEKGLLTLVKNML